MYITIRKLSLTFIFLNVFISQSLMADMLFYYNAAILPSIISSQEEVPNGIVHNVSDLREFRSALEDAALNGSNDIIILDKGVYRTHDDGIGTFYFADTEDYNLTIKGAKGLTRDDVVLDGENTQRVLDINMDGQNSVLLLENLSLYDGGEYVSPSWKNGGCLSTTSSLIMDNTKVSSCGGLNGGAIYVYHAQRRDNAFVKILDSNLSNNASTSFGAAIYVGGYPINRFELINSNVSHNKGWYSNANIIQVDSETSSLKNTLITDNIAQEHTLVGIYHANIESCIFKDNYTNRSTISSQDLTISNSTFSNNITNINILSLGGDSDTQNIVKNSKFINNTSNGGSYSFYNTILVNNLFQGNKSTNANYSFISMDGGYIVNNTVINNINREGSTRGLLNISGTIINSIFENNETINEISFSGNSNLYNSYVDYGKLSYGSYTVIKKDNLVPAYGDISVAENGELGADSLAIDTGLNPESGTFKDLIGNDADYQIILDALQTDLIGNPRINNDIIDMGAIEYDYGN